MSKINEIKERLLELYSAVDYEEIIDRAMIEYAEYYAMRCLEIAAENAECEQFWRYGQYDEEESYFDINKDSILNIQLPEHE
jgi:hypothetical protein